MAIDAVDTSIPTSSDAIEPAGGEEFVDRAIPVSKRRSTMVVSSVWLGFPMIMTCAVFGGTVVYALGFVQGLLAILCGVLILTGYVGALSYFAGRTGENFSLSAGRTFGAIGHRIPAGFLSTVVIGWFAFQSGLTGSSLHAALGWPTNLTAGLAGLLFLAITLLGIRALSWIGAIAAPMYVVLATIAIVLASRTHSFGSTWTYHGHATLSFGAAVTLVVALFADSGTMTGDFTRWARNGRSAVIATLAAFPVGNFIALLAGAIFVGMGAAADPASTGGDFLSFLTSRGGLLVPLATVFTVINLGSVCTHCLYNGAVGWSQLTGTRMRMMTVLLGLIGSALAFLGIWNHFDAWLNLLGVIVPPIGAVLITDELLAAHTDRPAQRARWHVRPLIAWAVGALAASLSHAYAQNLCTVLVGILVAALTHFLLSRSSRKVLA